MKLGCFADAHCGAHLQYAPDRLAEQETVLHQAVEVFNQEGCDAIVFAGDATHTNRPAPAHLIAFLRPLLAARAPIYAVSGNKHDVGNTAGPIALEVIDHATLNGKGILRLSRVPEIHTLGDLRIATLPWASVDRLVAARNGGDRDAIDRDAADRLIEIAAGLRAQVPDGCASVLVTHFGISGGADGLERFAREPILNVHALAGLGFDAVVAGHFHRGELLHAAPPVFFCGSPYPLNFGEGGYDHGVWILDVAPGHATARFVPIESRRFVQVDVDLSWLPVDLDAGEWLIRHMEAVR